MSEHELRALVAYGREQILQFPSFMSFPSFLSLQRQYTCLPPSTRIVSPVMKSESMSARTAFAISSGPPQRPSGVARSTDSDSSVVVPGGARIGPGAIALSLIHISEPTRLLSISYAV